MTREEEITQFAKSETTLCKRISNDYGSTLEEGIIIGAKWANETMINKACEWLNKNITNYKSDMMGYIEYSQISYIIRDLRKAMEK